MKTIKDKYLFYNKKSTEVLVGLFNEYISIKRFDGNFKIIKQILINRNVIKQKPPAIESKESLRRTKFILFFALIFIFCIIFIDSKYNLFPKQNSNHREVVYNSGWDSSVSQVVYWLKNNLKDSSSLKFISWSDVYKESNGSYSVRVKYKAKNSFGGYSIENKIFYLNSKGKIINYRDY